MISKVPVISTYIEPKLKFTSDPATNIFITGRANHERKCKPAVLKTVPEGFKYCPECEENKEKREFNKNRANRDGLDGYCRGCKTEKTRKYRISILINKNGS